MTPTAGLDVKSQLLPYIDVENNPIDVDKIDKYLTKNLESRSMLVSKIRILQNEALLPFLKEMDKKEIQILNQEYPELKNAENGSNSAFVIGVLGGTATLLPTILLALKGDLLGAALSGSILGVTTIASIIFGYKYCKCAGKHLDKDTVRDIQLGQEDRVKDKVMQITQFLKLNIDKLNEDEITQLNRVKIHFENMSSQSEREVRVNVYKI